MAVMNPCCCRLQLGVKIVAIYNMVIAAIGLVYCLIGITIGGVGLSIGAASLASQNERRHDTYYGSRDNDNESKVDSDSATAILAISGVVLIVITVIVIISCLVVLVLSYILYQGAQLRNMSKCRLWFVVTLIFLVIYIFFKILGVGAIIWAGSMAAESGAGVSVGVLVAKSIVELIVGVAIEAYQLWVVYAFMDELKRGTEGANYAAPAGTVHYAPKTGEADNYPPPYGQSGYAPYGPAPPGYPYAQTSSIAYPVLPTNDDSHPYKATTMSP